MLQFQYIINNKNIFHTSPYMTNKAKFDSDAIIFKYKSIIWSYQQLLRNIIAVWRGETP